MAVFPDWDAAGLERFRGAGWTLQALVDYRRSNDPSWSAPVAADLLAAIASNAGGGNGGTAPPAPGAAAAAAPIDLSDPADLTAWVDKCALVFPVRPCVRACVQWLLLVVLLVVVLLLLAEPTLARTHARA